jgi:hypothetical protein
MTEEEEAKRKKSCFEHCQEFDVQTFQEYSITLNPLFFGTTEDIKERMYKIRKKHNLS